MGKMPKKVPHNLFPLDEKGHTLSMQSQQYRITGKVFVSGLRRAQSVVPPELKSDSLDKLVSSSGKHWDVKVLLVENQLIPSRHTHIMHL